MFAAITGAFVPCAEARTWHVTPLGGPDAPTVQAAIDSSQTGDVVLLGAGTYTWTGQGTLGTTMLHLRPGRTLRGEGGAAATILDAESHGRILLGIDLGNATVIEDLTFQNGYAPVESTELPLQGPVVAGPNDTHGGGIDIRGLSAPAVRRCRFINNRVQGGAAHGGAMVCEHGTIEDCEFIGNKAGVSGSTNGRAGALWSNDARIARCVFRANEAWGFEAASGGALRCFGAPIVDCVFDSNRTLCPGSPEGGAIWASGTPVIERCVFRGNMVAAHYVSANGGALSAGSGTVLDCQFIGNTATCLTGPGRGGALFGQNVTVRRCVFIANTAVHTSPPGPGYGGAAFVRFSSLFENCTLVGNSGGTSDGIGAIDAEEATTLRAVLVARTTAGQVCSGDITWSCCDVFGNAGGDAPCGTDGGGNFSADPGFCSDPVTSGDVGLRSDSPCAPGHVRTGACTSVGAGSATCTASAVQAVSWSAIKVLYGALRSGPIR